MPAEPGRGRVYPRVCGGTSPPGKPGLRRSGLSPRVRGNQSGKVPAWAGNRSIPACAGEPSGRSALPPTTRVYPRVCGGTGLRPHPGAVSFGLSPRVRGNLQGVRHKRWLLGSIPACAGEPVCAGVRRPAAEVYPRVCGGTAIGPRRIDSLLGLSPRVRGNQPFVWRAGQPARSIPACAGEPQHSTVRTSCQWVYPRVCGGTAWRRWAWRRWLGLSPRVRGNHPVFAVHPPVVGSIPACAGEPQAAGIPTGVTAVYPRVCGGTGRAGCHRFALLGLSPRVRGNRRSLQRRAGRPGSIPACAGEPLWNETAKEYNAVYPRVCGGTVSISPVSVTANGLSPRVRGNRRHRHPPRPATRSIPACAGEPMQVPIFSLLPRVYPRVCGGTAIRPPVAMALRGLSPRVRGNRYHADCSRRPGRSIPACAGEPVFPRQSGQRNRVYPRVCGGTMSVRLAWSASLVYPRVCGGTAVRNRPRRRRQGLSPRVRGNRHPSGQPHRRRRSIPACAGEPGRIFADDGHGKVYPRVCGGTRPSPQRCKTAPGLSPRVRGNHFAQSLKRDNTGSIPACAGEPRPPATQAS